MEMTFRQKLDNYWYHYKWHTIIIGFFLAVFLICFIQCTAKEEYDANLMYAGPGAISYSSLNRLQNSYDLIMTEDYNGDGDKTVDYVELTFLDAQTDEEQQRLEDFTSANPQIEKTNLDRFGAEVTAGQSMIYLLDERFYDMVSDKGILIPLKDVLGYIPENARDEYSIYLGELDIHKMPGFSSLPADTIICIRYPVRLANFFESTDKREKQNRAVFCDMINFVMPEEEDA